MTTIEKPKVEQPTAEALKIENNILRRQVEKLADENAELIKQLTALRLNR